MPLRTLVSLFGGHLTMLRLNGRGAEQYSSEHAQMYDLLRSFYWSDIYEDLNTAMLRGAEIHPIRNPTYRIVEFYARHLWPGKLPDALPIETENERLPEAIHLLWQWSNWSSRKQVIARENPLLGDTFIKAAERDDGRRVYMDLIEPSQVIDFEVDERENITWIHIEVPRDDGTTRVYHVEEWSKDEQVYRRWETPTPGMGLDLLGTPDEEIPLPSMGIDFVPFVHAKFRDIGEKRGAGAISLSLRKIWEADLIATALHQRLFRYNKADVVLTSMGRDDVGRPAPPISEINQSDEVDIGGDKVWSLPSGWDIRHWIANIDYRSALLILQDHMAEIENDNPELAYYNIREMNQVSGRAVRMLLNDAVSSVMEARGNGEDAMIRAQQMCLTMMRNRGLIRDIGSFDQGEFEHTFAHRDMFPLNDAERAEERYNRALGDAVLVKQLGWSKQTIQREWGLSDEDIQTMELENEVTGDQATDAFLRAFDSGSPE